MKILSLLLKINAVVVAFRLVIQIILFAPPLRRLAFQIPVWMQYSIIDWQVYAFMLVVSIALARLIDTRSIP